MTVRDSGSASKARADDYLRSMVADSEKRWLWLIVSSVLATRTVPKAVILDKAFRDFLLEHKLVDAKPGESAAAPTYATYEPARTGFRMTSVKHEKGVNALKPGATLSLHPRLTVVYGKNGSGKSGFMRILKRLAGSKTQEEIWQNVRQGRSTNRCSATVFYEENGAPSSCTWTGASGVAPFGQLGVFDGKAVPVHLVRGLAFAYQPLGFEVFPALSNALNELQDRLALVIRKREGERPRIDFCDSNSPSGKFLATISARTTTGEVEGAAAWNSGHEKSLRQAIKERSGLSNLDGQAEVLAVREHKLEALESVIARIDQDLSTAALRAYAALVTRYQSLKKRGTAKTGQTLEDYDIADMESDEWKAFIDAGESYIGVSHGDSYPKNHDACVYCLQKLSVPSRRLLRLYRALFSSSEVSDWEEIESQIDTEVEQLTRVSYSSSLHYAKGDYEKCMPNAAIDRALSAIAEADSLMKKVVAQLRSRKLTSLKALVLAPVVSSIAKAKAKVAADMHVLAEARLNIIARSRALDQRILDLQDRQRLAKHRGLVERYVSDEKWLAKARAAESQLNTRSITELGKTAWSNLVSRTFQERFKLESEVLRAPEVKLAFRGEYGSQVREKSVAGISEIDQVLSEGEQKAVALADFFAEQSMHEVLCPLVFDDPATSFDHERKELIAERIVQESGVRQIVVFTHDLMFAGYLHDRVLNSKKEIDKERAAFHDVRAEPPNFGVLTDNYYIGAVAFDATMKKVSEKMVALGGASREAQVEGIYSCYNLLRRALEKAVEERIFGKVINRWSDQIQMHNVPRASLDRSKLDRAKLLHEKFSRYIDAHNQSNEIIQHALPELDQLRADVLDVEKVGARV